MNTGARSPEELEMLLEDAFVTRDRRAVAALFDEGAVLVDSLVEEARGQGEILRLAAALWDRDFVYLAEPRQVVQVRRTALVLADQGINVVRRGADGAWRYAISLVQTDQRRERRDT